MEEDHKRKYDQLKAMVDQYKTQMNEYVSITQQNYQILGDITAPQKHSEEQQPRAVPKIVELAPKNVTVNQERVHKPKEAELKGQK